MADPVILVCGGRDFDDYLGLALVLSHECRQRGWMEGCPTDLTPLPKVQVIHGAARGADRLAGVWAQRHLCKCTEYPADWSQYGRGAGHIRNQQMLDEGKPDLVIACPGGRGTADMVRRARQAGVEVIRVPADKGAV